MKNLFEKTFINGMELKNRFFRSATWLGLAVEGGHLTEDIIDIYRELAAGGVAGIFTGLTSIAKTDASIGGEAKFFDDSFVEEHRRLTDAVHRYDARILMQIALVDGPVNELSTKEVEHIVTLFGDAAARAKSAGYDGVQIHGAHFFYLSKFISPLCNQRNDKFGGDQAHRSRILVEILKDMRKKAGSDFCITVKINSSDEYLGGLDRSGYLETCKMLAAEGIDAIEVSANGTSRPGIVSGRNEGYFLDAAAELSDAVDVPVILVGGLRSVDFMEQVLADTNIRYLSLSRPLVREPGLVQRLQSGDRSPARCISCNACYRTPGHRCRFV